MLKARILLKADVSEAGEGWSDSRIVKALDTSEATVFRTRQRLVEEGFEGVLARANIRRTRRDGGLQYLLNKHLTVACRQCPSLASKRVTPHVLRHTLAMDLLHHGADRFVIALWLGHKSVETTAMLPAGGHAAQGAGVGQDRRSRRPGAPIQARSPVSWPS